MEYKPRESEKSASQLELLNRASEWRVVKYLKIFALFKNPQISTGLFITKVRTFLSICFHPREKLWNEHRESNKNKHGQRSQGQTHGKKFAMEAMEADLPDDSRFSSASRSGHSSSAVSQQSLQRYCDQACRSESGPAIDHILLRCFSWIQHSECGSGVRPPVLIIALKFWKKLFLNIFEHFLSFFFDCFLTRGRLIF